MQNILLLAPVLLYALIHLGVWICKTVFPVLFSRARKFEVVNLFLVKFRNKKIIKLETKQNEDYTRYCIRKGWIWYRFLVPDSYADKGHTWRKNQTTYKTIQKVGEVWNDVVLNNKVKETEIYIVEEKK